MSKDWQQTSAEWLWEYARMDKQYGGCSPPHTRSGGLPSADIPKASTSQAEKTERQPKLTLEQMNAQLLTTIQ